MTLLGSSVSTEGVKVAVQLIPPSVVAGALSVRDTDEVMLLTAKGQSIRTRVKEIRETGRGAKGVRLVNLEEGDKLLAIAKVVESDEEEAANSASPVEPPAT